MKFSLLNIETAPKVKPVTKQLNAVEGSGGWRSVIREAFAGAWQRNIIETQETVVSYPTLYACIARIAKDIGKLTFVLKRRDSEGIWREVEENSPKWPVLRKPNAYQTAAQFRESWILSKLMQGNTYVMKRRDNRGVVVGLYVLDPCRVKPLVSDSGDIFYELWTDRTNLISQQVETITVPAREIIHDREITIHHPLIGVPPLCAAYWPAVKNLQILRSAQDFFANGAQPSGILVAPGNITDETATALQTAWDQGFGGENTGRVAVLSDGLKFEPLAQKSVDSQMVEQLRYSDEQICQPFGLPPFKVGIGSLPAGAKIDDINNMYYSDALQDRVEHMEALLDEGLGIERPMGVECDLWPLLRMDQQKQADVEVKLVSGAIKAPNEARLMFDLSPKKGGDAIYLQQQNYSLEALDKRDSQADPFATATPALPDPRPAEDEEEIEDGEESAQAIERMFA